jgi:shikimate dehydrogenase
MIDAQTRLVGLLGWPLHHTLSPAMHNAAFAALGLPYVYLPLPVAPGRVPEAVRGLVALGFRGANVTVPHKETVLPLMDSLSEASRAIGSVNTILVSADGRLSGDTTDGAGFLSGLPRDLALPGLPTIVVGAGGASRAVIYALARAGSAVSVVNRSVARAEALCAHISATLPLADLRARSLDELPLLLHSARLIVNATTVGLPHTHASESPSIENSTQPTDFARMLDSLHFGPQQIAYDLIYAPLASTPFLMQAALGGATTIDGCAMLVGQGERSFALWTGHEPPPGVMAAALRPTPAHLEES